MPNWTDDEGHTYFTGRRCWCGEVHRPAPADETPQDERRALEEANRLIADMVSDLLPEGVGFALMLFHFGEGGFMSYVSNARREDMIRALEEQLERFRSGTADTKGDV